MEPIDKRTTRTFGAWLRARRKRLGLTQLDLATRVGCARVTIQKLELGERRPSPPFATRLLECLEVEADERALLLALARQSGAAIPAEVTLPSYAALPSALFQGRPPNPLVPLIGRAAELDALVGLLRSTGQRLVTLTGPPGVGKTHLSLELGRCLQPSLPDGVWFVGLSTVRDPALLPVTIGAALGLADRHDALDSAGLAQALRERDLLLILDNAEHLLPSVARLAQLLTATERIRLLVTSRAPN